MNEVQSKPKFPWSSGSGFCKIAWKDSTHVATVFIDNIAFPPAIVSSDQDRKNVTFLEINFLGDGGLVVKNDPYYCQRNKKRSSYLVCVHRAAFCCRCGGTGGGYRSWVW